MTETGVYTPPRSFGLDSDRVLKEIMQAPDRDESVKELSDRVFGAIDREKFDEARQWMKEFASLVGEDDPELKQANTLLAFLETEE